MPVRSLNSSVLKWPDAEVVGQAARAWVSAAVAAHPEVVRIGYFGSYARGEAGVGSDLDLVAVVASADAPFERRALNWPLEGLPVPAEILVYTEGEWARMLAEGGRFARVLQRETVWLFERGAAGGVS